MNRLTITGIVLGVTATAAISAFAGYRLLDGDDVQSAASRSCDAAGADTPDVYAGTHGQGESQAQGEIQAQDQSQDEPAEAATEVRCD